jgi:hypothetical protein
MERYNIKKSFRFSLLCVLIFNTIILSGQVRKDGTMPQYLFSEFTASDILMKSGQTQKPVLNYNVITEKMVFTRDDQYYEITNPEMVDTVYIQNRKFIPVGKTFYEFLLSGPLELYIQHKGSLLPAGKPAGYGGTSQLSSTNYVSSIKLSGNQYNLPIPSDYEVNISTVFWIKRGADWLDFSTEKQFLKLFPGKESKLKSFIKENRIKVDRPADLVKLVKYCGSL